MCLMFVLDSVVVVFQILLMLWNCMIDNLRYFIMVDSCITSPLGLIRMTFILETVPGFSFINYHYLNGHTFYM